MKGFSGFGNSPLHQDEKITAKDKVTPASTKINVPGLTSITVADAKAEAAVAESDDLKMKRLTQQYMNTGYLNPKDMEYVNSYKKGVNRGDE